MRSMKRGLGGLLLIFFQKHNLIAAIVRQATTLNETQPLFNCDSSSQGWNKFYIDQAMHLVYSTLKTLPEGRNDFQLSK